MKLKGQVCRSEQIDHDRPIARLDLLIEEEAIDRQLEFTGIQSDIVHEEFAADIQLAGAEPRERSAHPGVGCQIVKAFASRHTIQNSI